MRNITPIIKKKKKKIAESQKGSTRIIRSNFWPCTTQFPGVRLCAKEQILLQFRQAWFSDHFPGDSVLVLNLFLGKNLYRTHTQPQAPLTQLQSMSDTSSLPFLYTQDLLFPMQRDFSIDKMIMYLEKVLNEQKKMCMGTYTSILA